ncbi:MAG: ABC transporter fused permease/ATP-binding protein [Myxococcota bacterium]|jgi:ABC transporter fused permease/ATP-binding protein
MSETIDENDVSWRRLLGLARPELRTLSLGLLFLLISSGLNLSFPMIIGQLVDVVEQGAAREALDRLVLFLMLIFAIMGFSTAMRAYLFTVAGERVVMRLRQDLFSSLVGQEIGFFDAHRTGELTNRLASDTTVLQNTVTVNVSMGLRFLLSSTGAIAILMWQSWKLTLLMLAVVPLVAIGAAFYGRALRRISKDVQDALAAATAAAEESLSGIRTVRAFAREVVERARYSGAVQEAFELARRRAALGATFQGVVSFAGYAAIGVVLWYGGVLLISGQMTMGELTSFLLYTFTVAFSVGALSGLYEDFSKAMGASGRVFELLDRDSLVESGERKITGLRGELTAEDVVFAYPTRTDAPVLQGLSLSIHPGEVVALVGPSGGGKSTVAALISRFYDPQSGSFTLDGVPLTELDVDWLREQVGVVSQEPILFASSIIDNIRYGRTDATREEVIAAAEAANAHSFISGFPEGYETLVGERGVRLSGGQKQRVAIARAILKDPRVLVLDEATSALDAESEHLVQEALDRLMAGRSTLVIAHRLSTVRDADRVIVLDEGRVVQEGSHDELVAVDGLYRRLVERQFAA